MCSRNPLYPPPCHKCTQIRHVSLNLETFFLVTTCLYLLYVLLSCLYILSLKWIISLNHQQQALCGKWQTRWITTSSLISSFFVCFLAFDFCRFCVAIRFFHPRHNGQWPPTSKDFYPRFYPLHFCPIFILEKEPVFPFLMFIAKQGNYWYHFYNCTILSRCQ